jgi:hypothetical protein
LVDGDAVPVSGDGEGVADETWEMTVVSNS